MTKTLETSTETKILVRARELIEQGWAQHADHAYRKEHWWSAPKHLYCAGGAIHAAGKEYSDPDVKEAMRIAAAIGRESTREIPSWNDIWSRTHQEVLAAFDTAISTSVGAPRLP